MPETPLPSCGSLSSRGFFFTLTGERPSDFSRVSTAAASRASISPFFTSPARVLASQTHCFVLGAALVLRAVAETAMNVES